MSKLSTLTKEIYDRVILTKRIEALTGGTNAVEAIVVSSGGTGYTSAPTVGFTGGGGTGAAATATVSGGIVVAITMTNHGSGYTSAPTIGFTGGGGSSAAATAILGATTLDAIPTVDREAGMLVLACVTSGDGVVYVYRLTDGTEAEVSPNVIRPDDYAGTTNEKYWKAMGMFVHHFSLADGTNLDLGTTTGSKLGTAADQKLGLWGVTPVVQPAGAAQAAVTLGNADNEIGGLTFGVGGPTQAETNALRDKCEELADDVRNLSTLIHALRTAGVNAGLWKGAA